MRHAGMSQFVLAFTLFQNIVIKIDPTTRAIIMYAIEKYVA